MRKWHSGRGPRVKEESARGQVFKGREAGGSMVAKWLGHSKQEGRYLRKAGEMGRWQRPDGAGPCRPGQGTGFYSKSYRDP